jgi:hypothetical protein
LHQILQRVVLDGMEPRGELLDSKHHRERQRERDERERETPLRFPPYGSGTKKHVARTFPM